MDGAWPSTGLGRIQDSERALIDRIVAQSFKTIKEEPGRTQRAQHGKSHGCVEAEFVVANDIPQDLRFGLFAKPATYRAILRFSNSMQANDCKRDAHGMAIKVFGVPGAKLVESPGRQSAHDFVLVDHPTFFVANLEEYLVFNRHFGAILNFRRNRKGRFGAAASALRLAVGHHGLMRRVRRYAGRRLNSPLAADYWSATPYSLGDARAVKYMARADAGNAGDAAPVKTADGLAQAMRGRLVRDAAGFDFGVHLQQDEARHPVEDATVDWSDGPQAAPFVRLARIEIPIQSSKAIEATTEMAEKLVFSPWHALPDHRPIGGLNRGRQAVYAAMAQRRRELNDIKAPLLKPEQIPDR